MSLLKQLLPAATTYLGGALDKDRSLLSNVTSGLKFANEVKVIASQIESGGLERRFKDYLNDPTKYLFLMNLITSDNPVKMVPSVTTEQVSALRAIWNKVIGNQSSGAIIDSIFQDTTSNGGLAKQLLYKIFGKTNIPTLDGVNALKLRFDNQLPYKDELTYYKELKDPYNPPKNIDTPHDAVDYVVNTLGAGFGYRKWAGFEIGSNHLWDIQLEPYKGPMNLDSFTYTPELPHYSLPGFYSKVSSVDNAPSEFSFGANCPAIGYNLQIGNSNTKQLKLFSGSVIEMPFGFNYQMQFALDVLDDIHGSFNMYLNKYINSIYDIGKAQIARYDQAALLIKLRVFKPGFQTKYALYLIGVPYNIAPVLEGENSPNETSVHVDFSIIGIKTPRMRTIDSNNTERRAKSDPSKKWEDTSWTDVTLMNKPTVFKNNTYTSGSNFGLHGDKTIK